jgi:thymidylate synthase
LSGSDEVDFIAYYCPAWASFSEDGRKIRGSCYGKRIFTARPGEKSQWERVKEMLRHDPESRRAVLTLYSADYDLQPVAIDQPCIATIQFLLRSNKLHCFTNMRSNDVIWGLCYDVYFLTMLHELLTVELGVELGTYHHSVASLHLYSNFYAMAEKIVAEPLLGTPTGMAPMDHTEDIPAFLSAEALIRQGSPNAAASVQRLHPYWRQLAATLLARRSALPSAAQVAA